VASSFWDLTKQRLRRGDPAAFLGVPYRTIDHRKEAFRRWTASVRGGRTLNFLHIQFPHTPWWYTAAGHQYTDHVLIPELNEETWTKDKAAVDGYLRRYVQQLRFLDRLVGELRASLVRRGIWDDALVVLVADHGVAFVPGVSRRFVSLANFAEIASVPLFVKAPHQRRGATSDEMARTIDLVPTIADYLGVRWPAQGRSLRRPVHRSDVVVSTFGGRRADASVDAYRSLRERAVARLQADVRSR
jgi:arylsulfatase A-like enzyme